MDFELSEEDEKFRQDVLDFIAKEKSEEIVEECESGHGWGPHTREFMRKLGEKRWLAPAVPREYGGMGATHIQRIILEDELWYHRVMPLGMIASGTVAPSLYLYGNE